MALRATIREVPMPIDPKPHDPIDAYHRHLDACKRCREQCFNQCPEGAALLLVAGNAAADSLKRRGLDPRG
jgi:hypothetical protein